MYAINEVIDYSKKLISYDLSILMTIYVHIKVCGKIHKPRPLMNLCYNVRR